MGARVGVTDGVGVRHGGTPRGVGVDVGVAVAARNRLGVTGVGQVWGVDVAVGLSVLMTGVDVPAGPGVAVRTGPGVTVGVRVAVGSGVAVVRVGGWVVAAGVGCPGEGVAPTGEGVAPTGEAVAPLTTAPGNVAARDALAEVLGATNAITTNPTRISTPPSADSAPIAILLMGDGHRGPRTYTAALPSLSVALSPRSWTPGPQKIATGSHRDPALRTVDCPTTRDPADTTCPRVAATPYTRTPGR